MASPGTGPLMATLHLFLLLAAGGRVNAADESFFLMMSSDGPVTSGALAAINATLLVANGSATLIADPRLYHFHWSYSPLLLAQRSENESSSAVTLRCDHPGTYPVAVWVTERRCSSCGPLRSNSTDLLVTKDIVGRLTASQAEANGTSIRNGSFLATNSTVTLSFLIHDPSHFFRRAEFSYIWSFGDGSADVTTEPFSYHNFSKPGIYHPALQVSAHVHSSDFERHGREKSGSFNAAFVLQDVIRNITMDGPLEATTKQNVSMSLHVLGSPPLTICWLIKSDCVSLDEDRCHPIIINDTSYMISHTFMTAGRYCLSARAQNEVSKMVTHYNLTVDSAGVHPLWFVLPCCGLLLIAVGFIFFTLYKSGSKNKHVKKSLVEVADFDFSPSSDKYETFAEIREIPARRRCCTYFSEDMSSQEEESEEEAEARPLLHSLSSSIRSYSM